MKKGFLVIALVCMFAMIPMIDAQTGLNSLNISIMTQDTYEIEISDCEADDVLYMNLTINEEMQLSVQVFRGYSRLPVDEVYNGGGTGHFEENITLLGGLHMVYLYNPSLESVIFVHGGWAINYEPPITTTTTTDTTTAFTETTGTTTGQTRPVNYLSLFLNVMIGWVIPALVFVVAIYCVFVYFRGENYEYLTIFSEDELIGRKREEFARKEE